MANTTHTVNPGGGADYTSLSAYEDAIDGTAYEAGETATVNCSGTTADTTSVTFDTWDADVMVIVNGEGCNTSGGGEIYTTSKYRIETTNAAPITINNSTGNIKINNVQVNVLGYNANENGIGIGTAVISGTVYIIGCVVKTGGGSGNYNSGIRHSGATTAYIYNNVVYGFSSGSLDYGMYMSSTSTSSIAYVYNNTIVNCYNGFYAGANPVLTTKNNIIQNCTAYMSSIDTSNANVVDNDDLGATGSTADSGNTDGIGVGTNLLKDTGQNFVTTCKVGYIVKNTTDTTYSYITAVDSDTQLTLNDDIMDDSENYSIYKNFYGDVTFANEVGLDFHLGSTDTAAIDRGEDLSGTFTDDIDTVTRTGTWDIGADEYTAGGGGVIKTKDGLAIASVKTVDGLAVGSVKTINGAQAN